MSAWESALLGFLQGATEFLPVSSSGHLVIGQALLGLRVPGVVFEVTVHLATLVSVLLVYRQRIGRLVAEAAGGGGEAWRYLGCLALATVPAALVGLLWRRPVEALFESPGAVGAALVVTGGVLWTAKRALRRTDWRDPGAVAALAIGVAQAFALVPGISRSGATVVAGLWLGVEPREAAAFSFLMSVPAIGGAALLQAPEAAAGGGGIGVGALLAGGLVAAATGVVAIRTFVAMLERRSFHRFAPYCWILGAGVLAWTVAG